MPTAQEIIDQACGTGDSVYTTDISMTCLNAIWKTPSNLKSECLTSFSPSNVKTG